MEMLSSHNDLVHEAFHVKGCGNALSKLVLGRAIHGMFSQIGYYTTVPTKEQCSAMISELKENRPFVLKLIDLFSKSSFFFERETNFVALIGKKYDFLTGEIENSKGLCIPPALYFEHLNHHVIPYSQASGYSFEGENYMVGALSRLNLDASELNPETRKDCSEYLNVFPSKNIFHNNLAQAIEILHCIDNALEILETTDFQPETKPTVEPRQTDGIGLIEAPRGNLFYLVSLNKDGKIRFGDIVTPSSQNQINMENDLKKRVQELIGKDAAKKEIVFEMEKIIRAYDPCFSCASHFLKVKWTGIKPA
jgi:coenzyme F420-reducing hydrogenase alpha subunit